MQVTIDLPDKLTTKIINQWGNLPQKILNNLVLEAFRERLIDFEELKDLLNFPSDTELKEFLIQNNILHSAGLLNLYGTCADIDFATDDEGIYPETDDDLIEVINEK
ncbi:hypothetical protein [Dolichospermum sp. UHCC 0259]|uniref:hypothetical protein n=1 Tax=Dolichospermum sp. UHCC 0259 TaxID=2590010 RepID=UPI001446040E|nr:hypothetical protein [Dolichospermum sp. UHCC 0259]MTJ48350.1 hypothetical protein [Dolichospermum sp. UHCC 0259]